MSLKTTDEKIDEIHTAVTRLETLWDGGPGGWPQCLSHDRTIAKLTRQNNWILRTMLLVILTLCASAFCASAQTTNLNVLWKWSPDLASLGGLSTNDYMTNLVFTLYSSTNATVPLTNWIVVTNWPAVPFLAQGPPGTMWTNRIAWDQQTRFYVMKAKEVLGGEESPFSNQAMKLAPLLPGVLGISR
jgi:hypothetical protein